MVTILIVAVVAFLLFAVDWINWDSLLKPLQNCKGVKLVAPNLSFEASGTIAKIITYAKVRGIKYARSWFKPANPQTFKQTSIRLAAAYSVAYWQDTLTQTQKDAYGVGASGTKNTGFSLYVGRCLDAWMTQFGTAETPVSVGVVGNYPDDVITWTKVV